MLDTMDKESKKRLILQHLDNEEDEDFDYNLEDIKDSLPVTWEDFLNEFNDFMPKYTEVKDVCEQNPEKRIDLRPYMEHSPHFVAPHDNIQKVVDTFRLHHLRYMPVIEKD